MTVLNGFWLLNPSYLDECYEASQRFEFDQAQYEAFTERTSNSEPGGALFVMNEGNAHVPIVGVLTKQPDYFFDIFGSGSSVYGDIIRAIQAADADEDVEKIVLEIDSPGGDVLGFFEAAEAIAATKTPIVAEVTDMAASAAFGLASQADQIIVNNPMAMVGSVGVATTHFVSENRVAIANTDAPKKRPDASTEEGVAIIREQLDAIAEQFAGVIARGRGVSVADVNADFGRGAMVLAEAALQAGMIDAINTSATKSTPAPEGATASTETERLTMTFEEFKAAHPQLFAQAISEGVERGVSQERDRVTAHVEMGRSHGCPEIAAGFIAGGNSLGEQTVIAKYLGAGRDTTETEARSADDAEAGSVSGAAGATATGDDEPDADEQTNSLFDALGMDNDIS